MADISAAAVKELRERTGAGMMECKRALQAVEGDMERAIEELRKMGVTKAGKKAGRIAAEGVIVMLQQDKQAIMIEINSETDFVARDANFLTFANEVAAVALAAKASDIEQLSHLKMNSGKTIEEARSELISKVGENVQLRRAVYASVDAGVVGTYKHGQRIGVMVELDVDNLDVARDIAMHIAASRPVVVSPDQVSGELIAKEKEIYMAQAATSGKPQEIIEKMVVGRLKKFLDEISLVGQPFVKDPEMTVGNLLAKHRAKVLRFHRYEVGEGIEKITEDFKEAVMSQVQGNA